MKRPKFIKNKEKEIGVFSQMKFHVFRNEIYKIFDERKLQKVYEKSKVEIDGSAIWDEIIYETGPFFIHVKNKSMDIPEWYVNIYYKSENFNEVIIFIRQYLKQLRDGTVNNPTT